MNIPGKWSKKALENFHKEFDFIASNSIYSFSKLRNLKESDLPVEKNLDEDSSDY